VALASSRPAEALTEFEHALAIARSIVSPLEEARAVEGIGRCQLKEGQTGYGVASLRKALAIYARIGSANGKRVETALREYYI